MFDQDFFKGKRILVTGHTGFKGSWLCRLLLDCGADITGYALAPPTNPALFTLCGLEKEIHSVLGDIRDLEGLQSVFHQKKPEIVFHLAAQPIVRDSYKMPVYTYETNVMGTVNVLECTRINDGVRSFLNVTTDKVYRNEERETGYKEEEYLNGFDPYSNSKSCSELVTSSYKHSFFAQRDTAISTARAGNVIGGGDFANDRIIPDCVRAAVKKEDIVVRNPFSIRPYQHVLESVCAYMMIAERQYKDIQYAGSYNVGPDDCDCVSTGSLVDLFCSKWGEDLNWMDCSEQNAPHEANFLKLDCTKLKNTFGWQPVWHIDTAVEKICDWTRVYLTGGDLTAEMDLEIESFLKQK